MVLNNITINQEAIEKIQEQLANHTAEELKQIGDDYALFLKKTALDFVLKVQKNIQKIKIIENTELKLKQKRNALNLSKSKKSKEKFAQMSLAQQEKAIEEYKTFKEDLKSKITLDTSLDDFFKECLIFNDKILEIITGKPQKIVIVVPKADSQPMILQFSIEELLKERSNVSFIQSITSKTIPRIEGKLKFDINKMRQDFNVAFRNDRMIEKDELDKLNETYNSALYHNYNRFSPYVVWKSTTATHWFKMKVIGGKGDLAEGYAFFFYKIPEGEFSFKMKHLYDNLQTFFVNGVTQVSNLSGLYAGDISTKKYQYAIKSLNASLPGYMQMLRLAKKIIEGTAQGASVEKLREKSLKAQYKKDKDGKVIKKGLRNIIQEVLESELEEFDLKK